jgi:hypothetical protein
MSVKTVAAFLAGALAARAGTAAALTSGHVFRLQQGDEAQYGTIHCQAVYSLEYSGFSCSGAPRRYSVIYAPDEIRVLRSNAKHVSKTVFFVNPSGGAK